MKLTEQHPIIKGAIITTTVPCACNDAGCAECVSRSKAAVRFALTENMTPDNAAAMTAILDGRSYDDPSRPMSRGDFAKAMQEIAGSVATSAAVKLAIKSAYENFEGELKARDAELLSLKEKNAELEHANAMHVSTLTRITAQHDPGVEHESGPAGAVATPVVAAVAPAADTSISPAAPEHDEHGAG